MGYLYSTFPNFKKLLLKNVIMPGSHDSGTGVLPETDSHIEGSGTLVSWLTDLGLVENIISKFAKTQYHGIKWQLESGVRFFDFRVFFKKNGDAYFHHGVVFIDSKILDSVRDVFNFLIKNPNEIIIIRMSHFSGEVNDSNHQKLMNNLKKYIGKFLFTPEFNAPNKTLYEIFNTDSRVMIAYAYSNKSNFLYNGNTVESHYKSATDNCKNFEKTLAQTWKMIQNDYLKCYAPLKHNNMKVLQAHLQYDADFFKKIAKKEIFKTSIQTQTEKLEINKNVGEWLLNNNLDNVNIIQVDFYTFTLLKSIF
jgi:hypothetical protein